MLVDVDDTIIEVHGYAKQGAGFGYSGVRGLNALLATVTTDRRRAGDRGPAAAQGLLRLTPRGAQRLVADALPRPPPAARPRPGRCWCGRTRRSTAARPVAAALEAGAEVSVTVRLDPQVKAAIAAIAEDAWTPIEYTDAVFDETTGSWISRAEVAEIRFTAFASQAQGRPGPRPAGRAPHPRPQRRQTSRPARTPCSTPGGSTRSSPPPTPTILDTVAADKTHRGHAIIEQVHADLKNSALAHLPSGVFTANAAWLVLRGDRVQPHPRRRHPRPGADLAKATTATIRRKLITVPARVATSARRLPLHLPSRWPWQTAWSALYDALFATPVSTVT